MESLIDGLRNSLFSNLVFGGWEKQEMFLGKKRHMHSQREDATSEQVANLFTSQCLVAEYQNTRCRMERCITCESKGQTCFKVVCRRKRKTAGKTRSSLPTDQRRRNTTIPGMASGSERVQQARCSPPRREKKQRRCWPSSPPLQSPHSHRSHPC